MLVSMTGFSNKTVTISCPSTPLELTCTLKSLNARFIEVNCKLPYALTHLETEIIKRVKVQLTRGTIYVIIHVNNPQALKADIAPSFHVIEGYLKALKDIQKRYDLPGSLTLNDLIHLPHIFELPELLIDQAASQEILQIIDNLAEDLLETRLKEGAALEQDINAHLCCVKDLVKQLEEKAVVVAQERKDQMLAQLTQLETLFAGNSAETHDQQVQLLQLQLHRHEITEELVRCNAHVENFYAVLSSAGCEKGKKLDFILQELSREINTVGSKAGRAEIANLAIQIKVELEKIREQVQNVL